MVFISWRYGVLKVGEALETRVKEDTLTETQPCRKVKPCMWWWASKGMQAIEIQMEEVIPTAAAAVLTTAVDTVVEVQAI